MRKLLGTCSVLLLLAIGSQAKAQNAGTKAVQTPGAIQALGAQVLPASSCPVDFSVTRLLAQTLRPAAGPVSRLKNGTALDLALTSLPASPIRRANISVYGLLGPTFMHVGQSTGHGSESLAVLFWSPRGKGSHATAYPVQVIGIQEVELHEVEYADGKIWREPAEGACRVTPNGYRLVAGVR